MQRDLTNHYIYPNDNLIVCTIKTNLLSRIRILYGNICFPNWLGTITPDLNPAE